MKGMVAGLCPENIGDQDSCLVWLYNKSFGPLGINNNKSQIRGKPHGGTPGKIAFMSDP